MSSYEAQSPNGLVQIARMGGGWGVWCRGELRSGPHRRRDEARAAKRKIQASAVYPQRQGALLATAPHEQGDRLNGVVWRAYHFELGGVRWNRKTWYLYTRCRIAVVRGKRT